MAQLTFCLPCMLHNIDYAGAIIFVSSACITGKNDMRVYQDPQNTSSRECNKFVLVMICPTLSELESMLPSHCKSHQKLYKTTLVRLRKSKMSSEIEEQSLQMSHCGGYFCFCSV